MSEHVPGDPKPLETEFTDAARRLVEDPLRAQLMAENEDANRSYAHRFDGRIEALELNGGEFAEAEVEGLMKHREQVLSDLDKNSEMTGEMYDEIFSVIDRIRSLSSLARTPEELESKRKSDELIEKALFQYGLTNPDQKAGAFPSVRAFSSDRLIRDAFGYASSAGGAYAPRR